MNKTIINTADRNNPLLGTGFMGFLKCKKMFWVENGEDGVSIFTQSEHPKSGKWTKTKQSIAYQCVLFEKDVDDLVTEITLANNCSNEEKLEFLNKYGEHLSAEQYEILGAQPAVLGIDFLGYQFVSDGLEITCSSYPDIKILEKEAVSYLWPIFKEYFKLNQNLRVFFKFGGFVILNINGFANLQEIAAKYEIIIPPFEIVDNTPKVAAQPKEVGSVQEKVAPSKNQLPIKKGDNVKFTHEGAEWIGKIVKYSSNKEIHIQSDQEFNTATVYMVTKEDIKEIVV